MAHLAEGAKDLKIVKKLAKKESNLLEIIEEFRDVILLRLPEGDNPISQNDLKVFEKISEKLDSNATLVIIGETIDLVEIQAMIGNKLRFHHWIAIKRFPIKKTKIKALPNQHFGGLIFSKTNETLKHIKTRIKYTYCPACNKTTKDYGGKKHVYHQFGTLMSDVWRDLEVNFEGDIQEVIERFSDLFGLPKYETLLYIDLIDFFEKKKQEKLNKKNYVGNNLPVEFENHLFNGDCLNILKKFPNNSIDFIFVDPPYNFDKGYQGYNDNLEIEQYFSWCDEWLDELSRVLKPGKTICVLNVPLGAIRHFLNLKKTLRFQNWIVWDALSFPVRKIMPAHYSIICFSKGEPRELPGLRKRVPVNEFEYYGLNPMEEFYCSRSGCIKKRNKQGIDDRGYLTDLWWDIHRIKHNSRRVDHPCQLPPQLMHRLISIFTEPDEIVLDCFNGAGTTTLAAQPLTLHKKNN